MARGRGRLRKEDYRLLAEFRHLMRQYLSFSEQAAAGAGLAPQRHQALLAVKGLGKAATVGALAERLCIRPNSAVGLVNRLVAARLLRRRGDRADRRRVILTLTPMAEKKLRALATAHRRELSRLAPLLKPLLAQVQD
jgi:DNA-binding MarR family transcriptional regulator